MKTQEEILNKINEMLEEECKAAEVCEENRIRWEIEGKKEKAEPSKANEVPRQRAHQRLRGSNESAEVRERGLRG